MWILWLPAALITLVKRSICWLLGTTVRAELTLIYTATAAGPALRFWLLCTALGTELASIFITTRALPAISSWSRCSWWWSLRWLRLLSLLCLLLLHCSHLHHLGSIIAPHITGHTHAHECPHSAHTTGLVGGCHLHAVSSGTSHLKTSHVCIAHAGITLEVLNLFFVLITGLYAAHTEGNDFNSSQITPFLA